MIKTIRQIFRVLILTGVFITHYGHAQTHDDHRAATLNSPSPMQPEFNLLGFGDFSYLSSDASQSDDVRVVRVNGKLPSDPGYLWR